MSFFANTAAVGIEEVSILESHHASDKKSIFPCERVCQEVQSISLHAEEMVKSYQCLISIYRHAVKRSSVGNANQLAPLLTAAETFERSLLKATVHFQKCLEDLSTLSIAMKPMLTTSSKSALPLVTNFFATFSRQLCDFYSDLSAASSMDGKLFQIGAFTIIQGEGDATTPSPELPSTISDKDERLSPPSATLQSPVKTFPKGPHPIKGQRLPDKRLRPSRTAAAAAPYSSHADPGKDAAEKTGIRTTKAGEKRKESDGTKDGSTVDPPFISVVTTIEGALSREVLMKRPDVFTALHRQLLSRPPELHYNLQIPDGKRLPDLVVENYIVVSNDYLFLLANDVLGANNTSLSEKELHETEIGLFQSADGPVMLPNEGQYGKLPACGWRIMSSPDHTSRLYTMYMFLEGPPPEGRSAAIHEVVITADGGKEEIVHVIKELRIGEKTFASVSVFAPTLYASDQSKAASLVKWERGRYAEGNYMEISDEGIRHISSSPSTSSFEIQARFNESYKNLHEGFNPTSVTLAPLDEDDSSPREGAAKGALAVAAKSAITSVLTAPRTLGKAVMDITGVTDAMQSNMEAALRTACPSLADQEILIASSCSFTKNKDSSLQGTFYLLQHLVVILPSSTSMESIALDYQDIKEVKQCRTSSGEAIQVDSHFGDSFIIGHLANRNNTFSVFMKQWLDT